MYTTWIMQKQTIYLSLKTFCLVSIISSDRNSSRGSRKESRASSVSTCTCCWYEPCKVPDHLIELMQGTLLFKRQAIIWVHFSPFSSSPLTEGPVKRLMVNRDSIIFCLLDNQYLACQWPVHGYFCDNFVQAFTQCINWY